jgi:DNA-binding PadR family transcriptional regulator
MHGRHHCEERWAAGRGGRHGHHGRPGWGGRHGRGGNGDEMRAGRMLAQGDLRLIALALIAEQPRHGYEIIKLLEDKTDGWYAPSPGIVYPTLTFLEETGLVTAQADGAKKLYSITDEGRTELNANRAIVDSVLKRLDAVGEQVRARQRQRDDETAERGDRSMPHSVQGAFQDLSEAVRDLLRSDPSAKPRVIEAIDRATAELRIKS